MTQSTSVDRVAVVSVLADHAAEHDRDASLPAEGLFAAHEAGLLTATAPAAAGGGGIAVEGAARLVADLGEADASAALIVAMTLTQHGLQAASVGARRPLPDALYAEVLDTARHEPVLINALRVEPALGTPARGGLPATVARRVPGGWRLDGRKIYSTGSHALAWMGVYARTDDPEPRTGTFYVRQDPVLDGAGRLARRSLPGGGHVTVEPTWDHLGLRASASHDVLLEDAFVPNGATSPLAAPAAVSGAPSHASLGPLAAWSLLVPALYIGVARAARDWLAAFLVARAPSNLGASLATLPRFQTVLGEIEAHVVAAEELVFGLASRHDAGEPSAAERAGLVKTLATRHLIEAVQLAVAGSGNPGLSRANPLERHLRDVLCSRVHTPQDDAVLLGVGRRVAEGVTR